MNHPTLERQIAFMREMADEVRAEADFAQMDAEENPRRDTILGFDAEDEADATADEADMLEAVVASLESYARLHGAYATASDA